VQQQVADGGGGCVRPPPQVARGQLGDGALDARQVGVAQQVDGQARESRASARGSGAPPAVPRQLERAAPSDGPCRAAVPSLRAALPCRPY
jgi:hypothetical protein